MKKIVLLLFTAVMLWACAGGDMRELRRAEHVLESDPVEAGRILDGIDAASLKGGEAALYSVLRTYSDYVTGRESVLDSLARIATDYWGSRRKGHYQSLSWLSLGMSYSSQKKDPEAIYALLKSKELCADTLTMDYALTNSLLGLHYSSRGLYSEAASAYADSRRLYEQLGECREASVAYFNIGMALFGKKEYDRALTIMTGLLDDSCIDDVNRNSCKLYMAHCLNGLYGKEKAAEELELVNEYLSGCRSDEAAAPGYAMKGIALYYLGQSDSSFICLERAHRTSNDLGTKILAVKGLEQVATQMKQYQSAWNAEILNKQYQEEMNSRSNQSEITQIRLQHNDEIQEHRFKSKVSKLILTGVLILIVVLAAVIIVNIQRDRRREAYYMAMHDDFIKKQMEEKAQTVENRLTSACDSFRSGIAFNLINDVAMERRSFKPDERDVIIHDINLYFSNQIAALRDEAGRLGQQDIMLIFCNILGIDQEITADIMCTSRSNMRSIKSRLKSKIQAETFSLYFKD